MPTGTCSITVTDPVLAGDLFVDTFVGGTRAGTQNGVSWAGTNNAGPDRLDRVSIVADPGNTSGYAMQFRYHGDGDADWSDDATCEQYFKLPNMIEVYIEWKLFIPSMYRHRKPAPPSPTPTNNKMIRIWDQAYSGSRVHVGCSVLSNSASGSEAIPASGKPSNLIAEWSPGPYAAYAGGPVGSGTGNYGTGPYTSLMVPGQEIVYGYYAHVSSAEGVPDGTIKIWVNGASVYNRSDLSMNRPSTTVGNANVFRNGYLPGWSNSGFTQTTDILLRSFKVRATHP